MTATTGIDFYPRTVALARVNRAATLGYYVGSAAAVLLKGVSGLAARIAQACRHRRDLAMLMEMDARMLADIGLTRGEIAAAAQGRSGLLAAAAERRDAAMDAVHRVRSLRPTAPALVPSEIAVRSPRKAAWPIA